MRIILTGASGLIGSAVARRLRQEHAVVTVGRRQSSDIQVDLSDASALGALDLGQADALVHCAGVVDEDFRDDGEQALRMAVFGADALVRESLAAGAQKLVYISSAHVYGPMVGRIDESCPPNPLSDYAIAHFGTEQVFRRHSTGTVAGAALRPCAVFGELPDLSSFRRWSLTPFGFPRDALLTDKIVIRSTGEQRRNFVGTEDVAESCSQWLTGDASGWATLNPVGALSATVFEFAQLCAEVAEQISGRPCEVSRAASDGPTVGEDFDYVSLSPMMQGTQSARETLGRLMAAIQQQEA